MTFWSLAGLAGSCSALASAVLAALILARRAAERAERTRRACHELRGALSALALGVELSRRSGSVPAARGRALELELGRATRALEDLARGGERTVPGELVEIAGLLRDSVEACRPAAAGRTIRLDLARCAGESVLGCRARLAQATVNLIANATEHGAGAVAVSARSARRVVRIEVCDDGDGLPAPLSELLGRRSRFAWPRAGGARGHGLRIAADAARAHGGRLVSAPSRSGARLVLELPLARAGAGAGAGASADAGARVGAGAAAAR